MICVTLNQNVYAQETQDLENHHSVHHHRAHRHRQLLPHTELHEMICHTEITEITDIFKVTQITQISQIFMSPADSLNLTRIAQMTQIIIRSRRIDGAAKGYG